MKLKIIGGIIVGIVIIAGLLGCTYLPDSPGKLGSIEGIIEEVKIIPPGGLFQKGYRDRIERAKEALESAQKELDSAKP